ncbi:hypothetical protein AMATHDRAFT_544 [Amanita thiersii Skay4041]|uniref:Ubiquitin fusion degradation protein 1 n=1 Tax=Amanita thiersii Skay4041 TaxID=703135 RepID=A0A2A9NZX1_9AGAR|nr:hypothetical protein AMATHDRAFT_544 [Amanita thiersii Skay4041]
MDFFNNTNGPGGLLAQLAGGFPGGYGARVPRPSPRSYDDYFKAYSMAMLPGKERENVSYGGKIIMPPSALASLTNLDLQSPWMFQLRNPSNAAASTHAGVLEFIAEEGCVHLPHWMMSTLRLNEGDPIRVTGTELPKGKLVKLQAQTVHFLEVSDPKAVLEQALRNFSALTQGDIIEISYNTIVFGLLVMETHPGGSGISVVDTDLEVDFAPPVGYVEPERPKAPPPTTMATKLKIDLNSASPGSSRPGSSLAGGFTGTGAGQTTVSKDGDQWESFKGRGETLSGRKTKGKGISHRPVEHVPDGSRIIRTDQHKIVSNSAYDKDMKVPAALDLPFGQLFFGFNVASYTPPKQEVEEENQNQSTAFNGAGHQLNGKSISQKSQSSSSVKGKEREGSNLNYSWGDSGRKLGSKYSEPMKPVKYGAGGASVPEPPSRNKKVPERKRSPTPDWGVDDDDVIMIDSD